MPTTVANLMECVQSEVENELLKNVTECSKSPLELSSCVTDEARDAVCENGETCVDVDDDELRREAETGAEDAAYGIPDEVHSEMNRIYEEMARQRKSLTQMMSSLRKCQKKVQQRMERLANGSGKLKRVGGGLAKPIPISEGLRTFMELPQGTPIARAEVTRYIHRYIKQNNLYDAQNRQFIVPNTKLGVLLDVQSGEKLHMFNIQQKMNPHFLYSGNGATNAPAAQPLLAPLLESCDIKAE